MKVQKTSSIIYYLKIFIYLRITGWIFLNIFFLGEKFISVWSCFSTNPPKPIAKFCNDNLIFAVYHFSLWLNLNISVSALDFISHHPYTTQRYYRISRKRWGGIIIFFEKARVIERVKIMYKREINVIPLRDLTIQVLPNCLCDYTED